MKHFTLALSAALALLAQPVFAQTLKSATATPANAKPGDVVTITSQFELGENPNCGVKIHFGDGTSTTGKVNQAKDATLVVTHAYAKPGTYTVMVEPKRQGIALKCQGDNKKVDVVVAAPVAAVAAAAAAAPAKAMASAQCPTGWKLDAKSVNKKSGAFTCSAKAGTAAPAAKLECPGSLSYVENTKKGQIGCRV